MEPGIGTRVQFLPPHLHAYRTGKIHHLPVDEKGFLVKLDTSLYIDILTLVKPDRYVVSVFESRNAAVPNTVVYSLGNRASVINLDPPQ